MGTHEYYPADSRNSTQYETKSIPIDSITVQVYATAVPILVSLCILAVVANTFILTVSRWIPSRLFKPPLKLTLSLAAADAWTSTVIAVGLLAHSYAPFVLGLTKPTWYDCASYGLEALRLGGMLTSVLHLLALALTQYFAAAHPHRYKAWLAGCRLRLIHSIIVSLWLVPPSVFFVIFGAYSHRTFLRLRNSSSIGDHRGDFLEVNAEACNADFLDTLGVRLLVFLIVSLPIAFMTVVYVKIFFVILALRRESTCAEESSAYQPPAAVTCTQCRFRSRIRRCTRRVITTLLTVFTFLLGWIPAATVFALTCSECLYPYKALRHDQPAVFFALTITPNVLMIAKGLVNPFIYAIRIPEIQVTLRTVFLRHGGVRMARMSRRCSSGDSSYLTSRRRYSEGDILIGTFDGLILDQHKLSSEPSTEMTSPRLYYQKKLDAKIYGSMEAFI